MTKRLIIITGESAWLVKTDDDHLSGTVEARASFGHHMPITHNYAGPILTGDDGLNLRPGTRLVFRCQCGSSHDGWGSGASEGIVTSGIIQRVVNAQDEPAPEPEAGFITILGGGSWNLLMPFIQGNFETRVYAGQAFDNADILTTLIQMGRVTQSDVDAARERRSLT